MMNDVEKGHSAFLMGNSFPETAIDRMSNKIAFLPQRLKKGIELYISSGETLPNAYRSARVNNTIVILVHDGKIWKIKSVTRDSVYKNSGLGYALRIPTAEAKAEISEMLLSKFQNS